MQWTLALLASCKAKTHSAAGTNSKFEVWFNTHCPEEFCDQGLVEYLLHGDLVPLAPCHRDSRIQIIDLGGA